MAPIPVHIITGFLGSGKTTLLARMLKHPDLANTAVVINEFGDVGLDHFLIESSDESVIELAGGCVCCTIRGDLAETLCDLIHRRRHGRVRAFDRIVIETTGLAQPGPILQVVMNDPYLAENAVLGRITTTVDALAGENTLRRHPEAVKQAAVADLLLVTKTDLQSSPIGDLLGQLDTINPRADCRPVIAGDIAPEVVLGDGLERLSLSEGLSATSSLQDGAVHHHHDHDHGINTFTILREKPFHAATLSLFLECVAEHCGQDLLRLKGLVNLRETPNGPAVIHGVQHVFHPPVWLDDWPSVDRRSRIVFIAQNVAQNWVEALLDQLEDEVAEFTNRAA